MTPSPLRRLMSRRPPRARRGRSPALSSHDVVSARIHPAADGVRIGHLSDLHVRTGVKPRRLHAAVEMLNGLRPDLVVLTGDYVCMSPRPLPELTAALKALQAPAYAVLGNHDHWSGAGAVRAALERAGVDVLQNEHRVVRAAGSTLHLVGVDDSVTGHDDPERAFDGVPEGATLVALSHDPKSADHLHAYRPALILSGHTHGGQVFIRRLTPFMARRAGIKYLSGFFEVNGAVLYVNRGLGASLPIRFRAPCEVGHLTLRSRAA
ncbi:MAG TPA: metallophosphoesterase [Myxococcales bacterium]|nr:metallophosphoesterase [Myxococcales bacterium]